MSTVHIVKCQGKNRAELIKALHGAIRELGGDEVITTDSGVEFYSHPTAEKSLKAAPVNEEESDEMIDVPSPYTAPALPSEQEAPSNLMAPKSSGELLGEVDAEGLPWDARIHASSKAKVGNGTWRTKRGVEDEVLFTVKKELRSRAGAPATEAAPVTPVIQVPNQPTHAMQTPVTQTVPAQQAPQVAPVNPPMPQMQAGHTLQSFQANFPHTIAALITEGKLTQDYVNSLCGHFEIPQIWMAKPEQQEVMFNEFAKYGVIQKVG